MSAVVALTAVALFVEPVARQELSDGRTVDFGPLQLKLAYNSGVAFSMGDQLPMWIVLTVTAVIGQLELQRPEVNGATIRRFLTRN
ncbi:MAG: hypothetical protein ABS979_29615, partial [Rhodococcus sp. (in: high G+C Gram-positive bacteria)]